MKNERATFVVSLSLPPAAAAPSESLAAFPAFSPFLLSGVPGISARVVQAGRVRVQERKTFE